MAEIFVHYSVVSYFVPPAICKIGCKRIFVLEKSYASERVRGRERTNGEKEWTQSSNGHTTYTTAVAQTWGHHATKRPKCDSRVVWLNHSERRTQFPQHQKGTAAIAKRLPLYIFDCSARRVCRIMRRAEFHLNAGRAILRFAHCVRNRCHRRTNETGNYDTTSEDGSNCRHLIPTKTCGDIMTIK